MKTKTVPFSLCLFGLLLMSSGCVNLDPRADPTRFYLVDVTPGEEAGSGVTVPPIAIRMVRLADYLDRPEIMVRHPGNQIVRLSEDRWAGQPSTMLEREITRWFRGRSGDKMAVLGSPWEGALPEGTWQLSWRVLRLEGVVGESGDGSATAGEGVVRMEWVWRLPDGSRREGIGEWTAPWKGGQPAELVRILGELLAEGFAEMERTGYGR